MFSDARSKETNEIKVADLSYSKERAEVGNNKEKEDLGERNAPFIKTSITCNTGVPVLFNLQTKYTPSTISLKYSTFGHNPAVIF